MGRCNQLILGLCSIIDVPSFARRLWTYRRYVTTVCVCLMGGPILTLLLQAFGFYAGLNVAAFVMIFFLVPGTPYRL